MVFCFTRKEASVQNEIFFFADFFDGASPPPQFSHRPFLLRHDTAAALLTV
jgi:hypothetical protein